MTGNENKTLKLSINPESIKTANEIVKTIEVLKTFVDEYIWQNHPCLDIEKGFGVIYSGKGIQLFFPQMDQIDFLPDHIKNELNSLKNG